MKNRMWSTILFILGIFLMCVTWIKGEAVWNGMQNIMWGLFGVSAALVAPIVIYVGIMLALDKSKSALVTKTVQGVILILLVSPLFEIIYSFTSHTQAFSGENFSEILTNLYINGSVGKVGGGALSIFLGGALCKLCGSVCALIIIILLIILFTMLLTNITFVDVWRFIMGTAKRVRASLDESSEQRAIARLEKEEEQRKLETAEKAKNKEKRVDVAKFITDDKKPAEPAPAEEAVIPAAAEPVRRVKPEKKTKERKKELTPADFIKPDKEEPQSNVIEGETVNPIYVAKDGQTTLIEMEDTAESGYQAPPIDLLNQPKRNAAVEDTAAEAEKNSETLVETLRSFGVATRIVGIHRGPSVTRYELQPAAGVKVAKITSLADDIALNLAANGVESKLPYRKGGCGNRACK